MLLNKLAIARSFSKAATHYDQSAILQRRVGERLLDNLPSFLQDNSTVLDLGCGTGYFLDLLNQRYHSSRVFGLDLSEGMLQHTKQKIKKNCLVLGDAEQLPIKDNSIDIIFSNLTLQWCHHFSQVLAEAYRVLKPQGVFVFSTLCDGSLFELKQSWQAVDDDIHVNQFLSSGVYQELMNGSAFTTVKSTRVVEVTYYQTVFDVMKSLKSIGAKNMNPTKNKGLTGQSKLNKVVHAYEKFREDLGLPSTYQVFTGFLMKDI